MNAVPDRTEYAIVKPPCKKDLRFGSSLALAGGMYAGFSSVGVRHIPRIARRQDTPITMHAKELPFPEVARNRLRL